MGLAFLAVMVTDLVRRLNCKLRVGSLWRGMRALTEMPHVTEDQYNRDRRLAGIFYPYAQRQIDETYGVPEYSKIDGVSRRFVHYTTAEAALKIIKSKRVWMRNTLCMLDYREVRL
jgi:hypothetical protein